MMSSGDAEVRAEQIAHDATTWFVRLNDPMSSDVDRRAFRDWLAADPAHGEAMAEVEALWKDLDAPAAALAADGPRRPALARRTSGRRRAAVALAVLAAAVAAVVLWRDPGLVDRARADHATRPGERLDVALPDGTALFLDGDTAISEVFADRLREVTILRGRVWFDVATDAARPFTVHADTIDVGAIGTTFGVDREEGTVTVESGAVTVSAAGDQPRRLTKGEQLRRVSGRFTPTAHVEPSAALAWRRGLIVLDAAPLGEIIRELDRMAAGRVVAPQAEVRAMRLSGVFRADDPEGLVEAMRNGLGLKTLSAPGLATVLYR